MMLASVTEVRCRVPAGAIVDQHCVRVFGDMALYLIEMQLHGICVGKRRQSGALPATGRLRRTNRRSRSAGRRAGAVASLAHYRRTSPLF